MIKWNLFNTMLALQYRVHPIIIRITIRGTSKKIISEIRFRISYALTLIQKTWPFYNVFKNEHPEYIFHLLPLILAPLTTRTVHNLPILKTIFKNSFFPSANSKWSKLDPSLRNSEIFLTFKKNILYFIRPAANYVYNSHNPKEIKLITRFSLGLRHLSQH